ncbi:putative enzyme related to lactoylglutathione lyase [Sphingomonas kyeonggiensis]|uniref:Putative enzyme related to lactoylglutathione lyase n=1 Tax=Sphingomonas kyeonggiensis TaxID=1268553 RepID=A0A7W7JXY9_9SPHN|nr:VOC family protein [Sphingomonas kyeonggiensis]MBB4837419.1 putative enzyme related to lactoylglutathione lyase [Sphingomonas kyeonggiensis]
MATTLEPSARAALGYDGGLTCAINVTDLDAGIAWYRDVLGMNLLYRVDEIAWCEFESPVARVNVGLAQRESVIQGGGATLTFGVVDIEAAQKVLDSAGVRQDGPIQDIPGMVRLLTFYDPDGNALMLYQDLMQGG